MTGAPHPNTRRDDERRNRAVLAADTHKVMQAVGTDRSASWVRRAVHDYTRCALTDHGGVIPYGMFLAARLQLGAERRAAIIAANPNLAYILTYRDPTGEQAVRGWRTTT